MAEENVFSLEHVKIGEILLSYNLITEAQLQEALRFQETSDKRLGEILIELEVLNSTQVAEALAVQLELPFIQLERYQASPEAIKFYEDAFKKAMENPDYVATAEKAGITTLYINAEDTAKLINQQYTFCTDEVSKLWE